MTFSDPLAVEKHQEQEGDSLQNKALINSVQHLKRPSLVVKRINPIQFHVFVCFDEKLLAPVEDTFKNAILPHGCLVC